LGPDVHKLRILLASRLLVSSAPAAADRLPDAVAGAGSGARPHGAPVRRCCRPVDFNRSETAADAAARSTIGMALPIPAVVGGTAIAECPGTAAATRGGSGGDVICVHQVPALRAGAGEIE
jgi:hypothetical protein